MTTDVDILPDKLVVFCQAFRPAGSSSLDLYKKNMLLNFFTEGGGGGGNKGER